MELTINKQQVTINELAAHITVEQPVHTDVLLPDYCADIVKVLKCEVIPQIVLARMELDKLAVEGMMNLSIFYMSQGKKMCKAEFKVPFSRNIDVKVSPSSPMIDISCRTDYVTCRATSPRKLDVRAAATLDVKIMDEKNVQTVSGADGGGIQLKKDMLDASRIINAVEKQFTVSEDLDTAKTEHTIAEILRTSVTARLTDYKVIAGKVVVKGEAFIHILYNSEEENDACEVLDYSLPISQIISVDGVDEDCKCFVELSVFSADISKKEAEEEEETPTLSCDIMFDCKVKAFQDTPIALASDCYSTKFETTFATGNVSLLCLKDTADETMMHKCDMEMPEGVQGIIDIFTNPVFISSKVEKGRVIVNGKISLGVLAYSQEELVYIERNEDFECTTKVDTEDDNIIFFPDINALSTSYHFKEGNQCEIRCELSIRGCVYQNMKLNIINDIEVNESSKKVANTDAGMVIYFADQGESMWEIAKHYNTSIDMIMEENELTNDVLAQNAMLIIPIVQ